MRFPLLVILLSFLFISCEEEDNSSFYVAKNGVTIKARDWVTVGTTAELNGVTYTAVDLASLKEWIEDDKDPSKVVTTKVETSSSVSAVAGLFLTTGKEIKGIEGWDVSNWTSMQGIFYSAEPVNADLSGWDVSQVTDMQLFMRLGDVNININNWDVSNATDMSKMFMWYSNIENNVYIEKMDLSGWDVSKVTKCTDLKTFFDNANWPESKRPNFLVECD